MTGDDETNVCPHDPDTSDGIYHDEHGRLCEACADMVLGES